MPKVSVVVPVYKVEEHLRRCIDSLINQTLKDIEIILVDDGSPDSCPQICDEYAKKDSRIKVIHKQNEGLGFARNTGIENATGEFIGFVDSDDYVDLNMYRKLYDSAITHQAQSAYGGIFYVTNGNVRTGYLDDKIKVWENKDQIKKFLMDLLSSDENQPYDNKYGAHVCKAIFSRELIKKHNIRFHSEREYVSEDSLFDIDFMKYTTKVVMLPKAFYYYNYNPSSLTSVYREDRFEKNKAFYEYSIKKLKENYNDDDLIRQFGRNFISAARVCVMQEVYNSKKAGFKRSLKGIKSICNDELTKKILNEYNWSKFPFKKRAISFCMKHSLAFFAYLLVKMAG